MVVRRPGRRYENPEEEEEESGSDFTSDEQTYVAANRQAFIDEDGVAIGFCIHESVKNGAKRRNLTTDIENNGGIVLDTAHFADTVIIDEKRVDRHTLQLNYNCRPGRSQIAPIYVEPMSFVQRCIREGEVRHRLPLKQGMGGAVGRVRTPFTDEDDDNLAYYISRRIPKKKLGGRYGNNVYIELEDMGELNVEENPWIQRHPWQSWRERYRKNAARLDTLIKHYAKQDPPLELVMYHRRRGWSRKHQRDGPDVTDEEDENLDPDDVDAPDSDVLPETRHFHTKRPRSSGIGASLPSAAPAKKQRILAHAQEARRSDPLDWKAGDKGKKKAAPPSDDYFNEPNSSFTGEADQIDMQLEPPDDLEYIQPQTETTLRSTSFSEVPQTSQMTLVEANPLSSQSYPVFGDIPSMPRPSTLMPSTPPPNAVAGTEHDAQVHLIVLSGHASPPQIHRSRHGSEANMHMPSSPIGERVDPSPAVSPVPAPRPPAANIKARRLKETALVVTQTEAPYRNTRSRSRTVEPSIMPARPAVSKKSNKRKQKDVSRLEPWHESGQEEEKVDSVAPAAVAPISGTLEEEIDVENLLVTTADTSEIIGIHERPEPEIEMSPPRASSARSKSQVLDTDDEQTRRDLKQAAQQPLSQYPTSKYSRMAPKDVLRSLNAGRSASHSRQSSVRPGLPAQLRHESSVASSRDRRIVESAPHPRTPVRFLQPRKNSNSSTESFPVAGTRASDTKKQYEQAEKRSPYKPPVGTRAAQHVLSR